MSDNENLNLLNLVESTNPESFLDNAEQTAENEKQQRASKRAVMLENTAIWSRRVDSENQPALYDDGNMRFAIVVRVTPDFQPEAYRRDYTIAHIRSVVYNPTTGKSETESLSTVYALGILGYDDESNRLTLASHGNAILVHSNQSGAIRKTHDTKTLAGSIAIVKKAHKVGFGVNADSVRSHIVNVANIALDSVEIAESVEGFTV